MHKRTLAGVLSAVLCTSLILSESYPFARQETPPNQSAEFTQDEAELSGNNSFVNYLKQAPAENASSVKTLQTANTLEPVYAVNNVIFDSQNGLTRIISSQTYDSKVVIMFTDEDNPNHTYKLEAEVSAGDDIITDLNADLSKLPEYYIVSAWLSNQVGLAVCDPFILNTQTRNIQRFKNTDINDFEQSEQVVNLDNDESTNFLVLSEDTVKAETTENSNTLVSADYDQNVYTYANADESITSLQKGQFFYSQPTAEDIIAIRVADIEVDGDTAVITGEQTDDIDEMFDFVKIEANVSSQESVALTEDDFSQYIEQSYRTNTQSSGDTLDSESDPISDDSSLLTTQEEFKTDKCFLQAGPFTLNGNLDIPITHTYNFYKEGDILDIYFETSFTTKVEFSVKASKEDEVGDYKVNPLNDIFPNKEKVVLSPKDFDTHLFHLSIPTSVPGLEFTLDLDLTVELSLTATVGWEKDFVRGFRYSSETGLSKSYSDSAVRLSENTGIQGEIKVELKFQTGFEFINLVDAKIQVTCTLDVTAEGHLQSKQKNLDNTLNSGGYIFIPKEATTEDVIHACDKWIDINATLTVGVSVVIGVGFKMPENGKIQIFKKMASVLNEFRLEHEFKLAELTFPLPSLHASFNANGPYPGAKFQIGDCKNLAYRTEFNISTTNMPNNSDIRIQIKDDQYTLSNKKTFYAVPGKYSYLITADNVSLYQGTFTVTNAPQTILLTFDYTNSAKPKITEEKATGEEVIVTTSPQPEPFTAPSATLALPDNSMRNIERIQFGDNIIGTVSNNHVLSIVGSGDMYDFKKCPVKNIAKIQTIIIEDQNDEQNLCINNIGANAFSGATSLQKVYMPAHIQKIGNSAFYNCSKMTSMVCDGTDSTADAFILPESLTEIGNDAFSGCQNIKFGDLTIPKSVNVIGSKAFTNCKGIKTLTIAGNDETTIGTYAFSNCTSLTDAVLGEGIASINGAIFDYCYGIESLTLPYFGTSMDTKTGAIYQLFGSCTENDVKKLNGKLQIIHKSSVDQGFGGYVPTALHTVTVTSGTIIPDSFFAGMSNLKQVNYPDNITKIGNYAFRNCTSLQTVKLPESLTDIGNYAFSGCTKAEFGDLTIPKSVNVIGSGAFEKCEGIKTLTIAGNDETTIGTYAFSNCTSLTNAVLGKGIASINGAIFNYCGGIESLTLPYCGLSMNAKTGAIYQLFGHYSEQEIKESNGKLRIVHALSSDYGSGDCVPTALQTVIITGGTYIQSSFFSGMSDLISITLPSSTEKVDKNAFYNCNALAEAHLIGEDADWANINIEETGNEPLLRLIRQKSQAIAGDTDLTGIVDVSDAVLLARFCAEDKTAFISEQGKANADANRDGVISLDDVTWILRKIAKLD